jgi:hypothetical protein
MPCNGCGSPFEEAMKQFTIQEGAYEWHRTCWDKEVKAYGTD